MRKTLGLLALSASTFVACGGTISGARDGDGGIDDGDGGSACGAAFATSLRTTDVGKVDILLMVDNSASMGDKQAFLKPAIVDLVNRLVLPNCVSNGAIVGKTDPNGTCAMGRPEFAPVHDMHIGVVTSSLGSRLGDVCNPQQKAQNGLLAHNDDGAHLITRGGADEHAISDMQPSGFLAWFPDAPANNGVSPGAGAVPLKDLIALESDFNDLMVGVHQLGCGIESQMESWYRFLIQPDPYASMQNDGGRAAWVGVDATILAQRHDFLRPDSAVAIIALSDEDDSEIDVRSIGQQGFNWMASSFNPPKGTSSCEANPDDSNCTSCLLAPNQGAGDPNCTAPYVAQNDWGYNLNLRHVHMKQKYGIDPQFPITRYSNGLTSAKVPNRTGEYPPSTGNYQGTNNCTNPLFAASLPDGSSTDAGTLCNLSLGPRTPDMVFYAHIGGVPNQLLHLVAGDANASALTDADWTRILGRDPAHYDFTGIDPHMVESVAPRAGLPAPSSADLADPISGREWITNAQSNFVDLQFACSFPLVTPRDCSSPLNADVCDCPAMPGAPHDQVPPLCDPANITMQTRAKAYPTVRETVLAKMMGSQGVLGSICPSNTTDAASPEFGFRPAITALVDRLGTALANECLPQPLPADSSGNTTCSIAEILPAGSSCDAGHGLADAPSALAATVRKQRGDSLPAGAVVCEVAQLGASDRVNGSCAAATKGGWCYVTGGAAGTCPQSIVFSATANPIPNATLVLACNPSQCAP